MEAAARAASGRTACCSGRGQAPWCLPSQAAPTTSQQRAWSRSSGTAWATRAAIAKLQLGQQVATRASALHTGAAPSAIVSYLVDREGSERVSLPELQFHDTEALAHHNCPCGSLKTYESCCGHIHSGGLPRHAVELARARFTSLLLGNLRHLEESMHPDSPDHERPQLLAKACHVFQTLQPRLLDLCHGMVPGSDVEGEESHVVATALLVARDSSQATPHVFIEVDCYQLHEGQWMYHHKEHHMPAFGSFLIFYDKYGPGSASDAARLGNGSAAAALLTSAEATASALITAATAAAERDGRYRFDLVSPRHTPTAGRRTPSLSRAPTPGGHRRPSKPPSRRDPTPQPSSTSSGGGSSGPQARRTPALSRRAPTPSAGRGLTPQPHRASSSPTPSRGSPRRAYASSSSSSDDLHHHTITLESEGAHPQTRHRHRVASSEGAEDSEAEPGRSVTHLALTDPSSAALQQWLVDSWPRGESLVYMDDVDGAERPRGASRRQRRHTPQAARGCEEEEDDAPRRLEEEEEEEEEEQGGEEEEAEGRRLSASEQAQQLSAQQEMIHVLRDMEMGSDSWLFKQSGFRYET